MHRRGWVCNAVAVAGKRRLARRLGAGGGP